MGFYSFTVIFRVDLTTDRFVGQREVHNMLTEWVWKICEGGGIRPISVLQQ